MKGYFTFCTVKIYWLFILYLPFSAEAGWETGIPNDGHQLRHAICPAKDGGFWAVGRIDDELSSFDCMQGYSPGGAYYGTCQRYNLLFEKYNAEGVSTWSKIYGSPNSLQSITSYDVFEAPDSSGVIFSYRLADWKNVFHGDYWHWEWSEQNKLWAKIDYDGNWLWFNKSMIEDELSYNGFMPVINNNQIEHLSISAEFVDSSANMVDQRERIIYVRKTFDNNMNLTGSYSDTVLHTITIDTSLYLRGGQSQLAGKILKTSDGGYSAFLNFYPIEKGWTSDNPKNEAYLVKAGTNNQISMVKKCFSLEAGLYATALEEVNNQLVLAINNDKALPLSGYEHNTLLVKLSLTGNVIDYDTLFHSSAWYKFRYFQNKLDLLLFPLVYDFSGNSQADIAGVYTINPADLSATYKEAHIQHYNGNPVETDYFTRPIILNDGGYVFVIINYDTLSYKYAYAFVKLDADGDISTSLVKGSVFGDQNMDCTFQNSEVRLNNYPLKIMGKTDTLYTTTDSLGNYILYMDSGQYKAELIYSPDYPSWNINSCSPLKSFSVGEHDSASINFSLQAFITAILNQKYNDIRILVYPNPFADKTELLIKNYQLKNPLLQLYDLAGNLIREIKTGTGNKISIDRAQLSSGIYFYKLFDNAEEIDAGKIVAQ